MKEPNIEEVATHDDPESCVSAREGSGEALTGARAGRVLCREIKDFRTPTPLSYAEGKTLRGDKASPSGGPARSETPGMYGNSMRENRESCGVPASEGVAGRVEKAKGRNATMYAPQQSDRSVVPSKSSNKAEQKAAEAAEGRDLAQGNTEQQNVPRTQSRTSAPSALDRVRQRAKEDRKAKFTTLLHHVDIERLRAAYQALSRKAAPGIDGQTWDQYGANLEENLRNVHERIHKGGYYPKPSRRVYIPKADGRQRPLGLASLEDKLVQRAVVEVLNAIYEVDFLGFSYGFRAGRGQHNALDALATAIQRRKVSFVLDADIRGFYDAIDHEWLMQFVEHRVGDRRVLRLLWKWLRAGVMEEGHWSESKEGAPQGATASPLLANIYLHYVFDLWVEQWRRRQARGDVVVVRYADDIVVGFQHEAEAIRFRKELEERMRRFKLELYPEKTRLLRFGKYARAQRQERGQRRPETFDFLGFTHICGRSRSGKFLLTRQTMAKRLRSRLKELEEELERKRHQPVPEQGRWLGTVVRGYFA